MSHTPQKLFDEQQVLHTLKHYLPTQGPLKDFVHHNTLHAFQDMRFYDAIFKASTIFGFQTTLSLSEYRTLYDTQRINARMLKRVIAERKGAAEAAMWLKKCLAQQYAAAEKPRVGNLRHAWSRLRGINMDTAVHPLLFRTLSSYIDQGIALVPFPFENRGLLAAVRALDAYSAVSFFKTSRARRLLHNSSVTLTSLLELVVGRGKEAYYAQYIYDQQFAHRGWSGMVSALEDRPESLLYPKRIALTDLIMLELLLEIDALTERFGNRWKPLGEKIDQPPAEVFADAPRSELQEVLSLWQDAFEWSYYDAVLTGLMKTPAPEPLGTKSFQAIFCIDEREGSLRRYLEQLDPRAETLGAPGFFGVAFYFQPAHAKFYDKLCPTTATPQHLIREISHSRMHRRKREVTFSRQSYTLLRGYFFSLVVGIIALGKLIINLVRPAMSPAIADAFAHMDPRAELTIVHTGGYDAATGLQIGFTVKEMTDRVETLLRSMGQVRNFAPLVYVVGHGSSSANNPHHGAHDCGACSGRPGLVNARVLAYMANYPPVRAALEARGLIIPPSTQFVGALHDTASDEIAFYDETRLSPSNQQLHDRNRAVFEEALDYNAAERSRRFASVNTRRPLPKIRRAIKRRSVSYYEPRPELGHGTNAICVVGRRELTKRLFLDRRAFLSSYDYTTDPEGALLAGVLAPLGTVCGGINLEYYFSRMDNYKLGAGTKLPHNVMGLVGVANSSDGDLRPGLPLQMIEVHDPVRLLMVVEHRPAVILRVIESNPDLREWFAQEWIHLAAFDPITHSLQVLRDNAFVPYITLAAQLPYAENHRRILERSTRMRTNQIVDATRENLPVYVMGQKA